MLKLKLQYFDHLRWRADSFEKTWCRERLKVEGEGDDRGWDGWMASLTQWAWFWVIPGSWWWTLACCSPWGRKDWDTTEQLNWSDLRLIIAFLPRSNCLLILWLQSPSAVILEPKKIKSVTVSIVYPSISMKWWDQMPWSFECWVLSQLFHSPLSLSSRGSSVLHFLP